MYAQLALQNPVVKTLGTADSLEPRASRLFDREYRRAQMGPWGRLFGKNAGPLFCLDATTGDSHLANRYAAGSRTVALKDIQGTIDRPEDFDRDFRPLKPHVEQRWVKVATALLRGMDLPPVELIQVGETYYVKDGHHRISVARALNYNYIDAVVEVWESA